MGAGSATLCPAAVAVGVFTAGEVSSKLPELDCVGSVGAGTSTVIAAPGSPFWGAVSAELASAGGSLDGAAADWRSFSRFFSSVRRKALSVVRKALLGLQRSGETGV